MIPEIVKRKIKGYRMRNMVKFIKTWILGDNVEKYGIKNEMIILQAEKLHEKLEEIREEIRLPDEISSELQEILSEFMIYPVYMEHFKYFGITEKIVIDLIEAYHGDGGQKFKRLLDHLNENMDSGDY